MIDSQQENEYNAFKQLILKYDMNGDNKLLQEAIAHYLYDYEHFIISTDKSSSLVSIDDVDKEKMTIQYSLLNYGKAENLLKIYQSCLLKINSITKNLHLYKV